ncbi:hypothetical protein SAMN04489740_2192 [Arthrobacter alpinus]|uniref:PH domain-containing protein n=1 Tax=Arthrobacter alpinus TaxID=656366 RepID=A0A1H5KVQ4_9MICC|nr:hypothetical protein [Arthrobacter alpinus]SEE68905.1 hypothetical protein SAMN04489740_2192 [Arthrobacter alpinus]
MENPVLRYVLIFGVVAVILFLVSLLAVWFKKHPNRSKGNKRRIRMPKVIPILAWPVLVVGLIGLLASFGAQPEDAVAMPIAFGAVTLAGGFLLFIYRNWYVDAGDDDVEFRTIFGKEHRLAYSEIKSYTFRDQGFQRFLNIRGPKGEKLDFSISQYNLPPLMTAIGFHSQYGRWPLPGEPR